MCGPMKSSSGKLAAAAVAVVLVAALFWAASLWTAEGKPRSRGRGPVPVEIRTVESRWIEDIVTATGSLVAPEAVVVTTEAAGRVESIHFEEGDRVETGALLITLEQEDERARLEEARTRAAEAERELERQRVLYERDVASEARLDAARTARAQARAALQAASEALDDRHIEAPFAGVTGRRLVSPGALLEPGDPITRLVKTRSLDLLFEVPGNRVGGLRRGLRVRGRTPAWPGEAFEGEVDFVGSEVDPQTRSLPLEARLEDEQGRLKPGMFMDVELVLGEREALTLPEASILSRGPASYVFVVDEKDVARRVPVEPGLRKQGWVEIVEGLAPGDRVVVAGLQDVRDGAEVEP